MSRRFHAGLSAGVLAFVGTTGYGIPPDDPDFDLQWGLHNTGQEVDGHAGQSGADIKALGAWEIHSGTASVIVAIVGRGVDPHPEFADRLLEGHATVGDPFSTLDTCPHDTHLAGIMAAGTNDGLGIAGIEGRARLLPVRVFDGCMGTASATAKGIRWAADHQADVILVPIQFAEGTPELEDAVGYARANDAVVVAPVGSAGVNEVYFPAAYEPCLAVSATTNQDTISSASNYGPEVDLAAPGRDIWSTWTDGGYALLGQNRDTAAASAFVAGVAALVRSHAPQLSAAAVVQVLLDSAADLGPAGPDPWFGAGRVDAAAALERAPPPVARFEHVEPFPTTLLPDRRNSFVVRISAAAESVIPGSARVFSRSASTVFAAALLTPLGDDLYLTTLPPIACNAGVEYFLTVTGAGPTGATVTDPMDGPGSFYRAEAVVRQTLFTDDFETNKQWEADADGDADTTGRWVRVIPVGTSAQPGFDYSPDAGRFCYVTGQHVGGDPGTNDVDGGPVRLASPTVELNTPDAEVSYARWFSWSQVGQEDFLTVELSRDGGQSWTTVETVSSTGQWVVHRFRLSEFPEVSGDRLRVRFSTRDSPNDSLTEAAIDEFRVSAIRCSPLPGDVNRDGVVDPADFQQMVGCWTGPMAPIRRGACSAADVNDTLHVDLADFQVLQHGYAPRPVAPNPLHGNKAEGSPRRGLRDR